MLPRKFPKLGSILVNPMVKFGGIELEIRVHEACFGFHRNIFAIQDTLAGRLGCIIPFDGSIANTFTSTGSVQTLAINFKDG